LNKQTFIVLCTLFFYFSGYSFTSISLLSSSHIETTLVYLAIMIIKEKINKAFLKKFNQFTFKSGASSCCPKDTPDPHGSNVQTAYSQRDPSFTFESRTADTSFHDRRFDAACSGELKIFKYPCHCGSGAVEVLNVKTESLESSGSYLSRDLRIPNRIYSKSLHISSSHVSSRKTRKYHRRVHIMPPISDESQSRD